MSDASSAPAYDAPPAYVPLSGGAITALVLALLLAIFALVGPWWLEALPLLIAALAWGAISRGERRGGAVAVIAAVIALVVGVLGYVTTEGLRKGAAATFSDLGTALDKGDRATLTTWVVDDKDLVPDALVSKWVADWAKVREKHGAWSGRATVPFDWFGPFKALFLPPDDLEDAVDPSRPAPALGTAFWFRCGFSKGDIWVAGVIAADSPTDATKKAAFEAQTDAAVKDLGTQSHPRVRDLRFFRPRGA